MSARPEDYGTKQQVMEIYAGVWGAAPDFQGVNHWTADIDERGGTLVDLATAFFEAPLVQEKYDGLEGDDLITALYNNIFRVAEPDAEGFAYWQGQVEEDPSLLGDNIGTLIMQMIDGMWDNEEAAETQALYTNFVSAGEKFVAAQEAAGSKAFSDMTAEEQADFLAGAQALAAAVTSESTEEDLDAAVVVAMESVVPAPAPAEPLTLAEALGMEELPDGYEIDAEAEAFDAGDVTVAAALEAFTNVTAILEGAANAEELDASELFVWSVVDDADAIIAAIEEAAVTGAASVSLTNETITQAQADALNALENFELGDVTVTVPGETITLTEGRDWVGPEAPEDEDDYDNVFLSTENDDTIVGAVTSLTSQVTFNRNDQIDGGEGNNKLELTLERSFAGFNDDGFMKNVQTVELTNDSTVAREFNATNIEDVDTYVLNAEKAGLNLAALAAADIAVNLNDQASGNLVLGFEDDAVEGDEDSLTLGLNNVGRADADGNVKSSVNLDADGIEELTINSTGESTNFVSLAGSDSIETVTANVDANLWIVNTGTAESLTAEGAGDLSIGAVGSDFESLDASGMTGDVNADLRDSGEIETVLTGAGDDVVALDIGSIAFGAEIDGGEGENELVLDGAGDVEATMSRFQTLTLDDLSGDVRIFGENLSDVSQIRLLEDSAGHNVQVYDLDAPTLDVETVGEQDSASTVSFFSEHDLTISTTASEDTAEDESQDVVNRNFSAAEATSLVFNVGEWTKYEGTVTANAAAEVTLNVATSEDDDDEEQAEFAGTLTANNAETVTVNAQGNLGGTITANAALELDFTAMGAFNGVTLNLDSAINGEITVGDAGTGSDDITLNAESMEELTVNAGGALQFASASDLSALQVLTVDTDGHFDINDNELDSAEEITLSGSDDDSRVTLQNIGGTDHDSDVVITATGLASNLNIGTIDTAEGQQVTADVSGVRGNVTISDITVDTDGDGAQTGVIDINADGTRGNLALSNLQAATVNIEAGGLRGELQMGGSTTANVVTMVGARNQQNQFGTIVAEEITITGGRDGDQMTLVGASTYTDASGSEKQDGALLDIKLDLGVDKITLGDSGDGLYALSGSVIEGSSDTDAIEVAEDSNLENATITNIDVIDVLNGKTLTLTAAQIDDLGAVWIGASDGTVNATELGEAEVDLSDVATGNARAGTATLVSGDVTLHKDTDLGEFSVELDDQALTLTADQAGGLVVTEASGSTDNSVIITDLDGESVDVDDIVPSSTFKFAAGDTGVTIENFTEGSDEDVLDFSGLGEFADYADITTIFAGNDAPTEAILSFSVAEVTDADEAASVISAFAQDGDFEDNTDVVTFETGDVKIFLIGGNSNNTYMWLWEDGQGDGAEDGTVDHAEELTLIGTLDNIAHGDLSGFDASNFGL
ncbi:beta strand repeat-containing protein [Ectothiorhodospira variabilis]|uniref:beta strand repeat-containing protein n=1 Tax=Ectothiorhodospira variabilis TaxID=505694 RepID=UPI001EFB2DC4|nr:hypothetical protein [Ectothiorhodospira variabilis]MCG5496581.1 hypothetical protein [Ectothiorhodospira variabilis]